MVAIVGCGLFDQLSTSPSPTPSQESLDPQEASLRQFEDDSETPTDLNFRNGFPTFVSGRVAVEGEDPVSRAENYLRTYQDLYLLGDPDFDLSVRRLAGINDENVVFYQTYQGIPIFASEIVVYLDGNQVFASVGALLTELNLDSTPNLTARQAEAILREDLNLPEDAPTFGQTTLMIFDHSLFSDVAPDPHLAWRVRMGELDPWQGFVDAHTGEVIFKNYLAKSNLDFVLGDAHGYGDGSYYCYTYPSPSDYFIGDENGMDPSYFSDMTAVNAWWYVNWTYEFYLNTFGRDSVNGVGGDFGVYIHAAIANARWNTLYGCELIEFKDGYVGYDIMVHEFTHGVIEFSSDLVYADQPGALNESYADVMASLADGNWTIGETIGAGTMRDLSHPPAFLQPDDMSSYTVMATDNGGVHHNSGIPNKVAYLIVEGGEHNGYSITGIGSDRLDNLYYMIMISLPSNADFMAARNATVSMAQALATGPGWTEFQACQVRNAFASVGLGTGDADCDGLADTSESDPDGDYIFGNNDNCPLTFNTSQADLDGDGIGDPCDDDDDADGLLDLEDNCPRLPNPDQADSDGDGIGDACEDNDFDGIPNAYDNCISAPNPDQGDADGDGEGDTCDDNDDNDSLLDWEDNCPRVSNDDQINSDFDSFGDACDNCPFLTDEDQTDTDGDGLGDACDDDDDGDGVLDVDDNCIKVHNPDQTDWDGDGEGYECDPDEGDFVSGLVWSMEAEVRKILGIPQLAPFPSCMPGCIDFTIPDFSITAVLTGLPEDIRVWVTDDRGQTVATAPGTGTRVLSFIPRGGMEYFLAFAFSADFPQGEGATYGISVSTGEGEEPPEPEGPTLTPLPQPPALGGETADATPTPSPSPTPTEDLPWTGTVIRDTGCFTGPDPIYTVISWLNADTIVDLVGLSESEAYVVIDNPIYSGVLCWANLEDVDIEQAALEVLPIITDPPPPTSTLTPTLTPTVVVPTATITPQPLGSISGLVWNDANGDGSRQGGEVGMGAATVFLGQGACPSSGYKTTTSAGNGTFTFNSLPAGTYCVSMNITPVCNTPSIPTTPTSYTITIKPGGKAQVAFGFAPYVC